VCAGQGERKKRRHENLSRGGKNQSGGNGVSSRGKVASDRGGGQTTDVTNISFCARHGQILRTGYLAEKKLVKKKAHRNKTAREECSVRN